MGIIAGAGVLPLFVAHEALKRGYRVVAIAFPGFTDPTMEQVVRETFWLKLGQLERAISVLKSQGIDRVIMAGKIEKVNLLRLWNVRPDFRALRVIRSMEDWRDDTVLGAIAAELSREGIVVDEITQWAAGLMATQGVLTKRSPNERQWRDIEFGRIMAQGIGALDIGQTVVVKNAAVLVAEAIEGTDKAIRRAAELDIPDGVVVKMAKPKQDMRFDVPGVGTSTIDSMIVAKAKVLAVEAGKTLIADCSDMIHKADRAKISVVGIPADGSVR
ncbi:MAG: UDP-2,3-diacylglucosamine diphosphatase LpxI [Desulfomonilaceae bacterium]|nr:UDP-2,3-diacylglucosamine diphosphatase LpxI [Desulfomonilaceae bacterium]